LIRQVARWCSHDGIRHYFEQEPTVSMTGEMGGNTNEDRVVEWLNDECKEFSDQCNGFADIMSHGKMLKPMLHVDRTYSKELGTKIDLPVRASRSFDNNILNLLSLFESLVPDVNEETDVNAFNNINIWNSDSNLRKSSTLNISAPEIQV
jgi:hypothetical protein